MEKVSDQMNLPQYGRSIQVAECPPKSQRIEIACAQTRHVSNILVVKIVIAGLVVNPESSSGSMRHYHQAIDLAPINVATMQLRYESFSASKVDAHVIPCFTDL